MTVSQAVETISQAGRIQAAGDRIRCGVPRPCPPEVDEALAILRAHKAEALRLLRASAWPPGCLAADQKFRVPAAKLYPLLDHEVLTPDGAGILVQVFDDRVQVHLKDKRRTGEFRPEQIAISADARQAKRKPS